jgi:hypothetical protein
MRIGRTGNTWAPSPLLDNADIQIPFHQVHDVSSYDPKKLEAMRRTSDSKLQVVVCWMGRDDEVDPSTLTYFLEQYRRKEAQRSRCARLCSGHFQLISWKDIQSGLQRWHLCNR